MNNEVQLLLHQLQKVCNEHYKAAGDNAPITLDEHYTNYLMNLEGGGSPRAFADKVRLSKIILDELGHYKLHELDIDVLSRFVNRLSSKTYTKGGQKRLYSQSHIDKIYTNLKCVLRLAVRKGLLLKNVMDEIDCPVTLKFVEDKDEALTDQDINMIVSAFSNKAMWRLMVIIFAYTGMRPGEVYALKFTDFDHHSKTVKVQRALSLDVKMDIAAKSSVSSQPYIKLLKNERTGKKEYARRVLTVGNCVINAVEKYKSIIEQDLNLCNLREKNGTSQYLFTAPSDGLLKRPDYYCNEYRKQLKRNGIDPTEYNLYRFRHTYCTRLFKNQHLDPKTVQRLMGDNDMTMVMRVYNSVNKDDLVRESAEFSKKMDCSLGFVS